MHLLTLRSSLFIYSPWYNHTIFDDTSEFSVEKSYLIIVAALKMFPDSGNVKWVRGPEFQTSFGGSFKTVYTKQTVLSNIIGYSKWNCLFVRSIKSFYNIRWSMVETIHWLLVHNVRAGCSILYHTGSRKSPDRQGLAPAVNTHYSTADNMRVANISAVPFITRCRCVTRDYKWR